MPPSLTRLPVAIQTLPWKAVDLGTVTPLEYNRALLLMNYVLGELAPVRASDSDLMSTYIDEKKLGVDLANSQALYPAPALAFSDGLKVAVALLRGPMSESSYAKQFSDASPTTLSAYLQMYDSTCQRRWAEVAESTQQARYMQAFLRRIGKLEEFQSWARVEAANREKQYEADLASRRIAGQLKAQVATDSAAAAAAAQLQRENEQLRQALVAAQSQAQATTVLPAQPQQASAQVAPLAEEDPYYYGGWYAPAYYGPEAVWARDPGYVGAARATTEARMTGFRAAAGRR